MRSALVRSDGNIIGGTKDAAGNVVQIREQPNGARIVTTSGPTDEKIEHYSRDGKLVMTLTRNHSEDEYDQHGNWIRSTQYVTYPGSKRRVNSVTTRKISYYE